MRLERLAIRGLGPFREESIVDLRELDGARIVAVVGPNGAGKSTTLELFPGALFRSCPTRGSLSGLAIDRAAYVEADVVNGRRYRIRQTVDAVSGKGEASVTDEDGAPLIESAKVRAYDAWAAAHLPPPEVLYASTFAVQGRGGFLDMKPAERKAVLLRVLGIERLEALAERARERARTASADLRVIEARLADARGNLVPLEQAEAQLGQERAAAEAAEAELARARAALEEAREERREAEAAAARAREMAEQRVRLETQLVELRRRAEDLDERVRNNREVLHQAGAIRTAVARAAEIEQEERSLEAELANLRADRAGAEADEERAKKAWWEAERRAKAAQDRVKACRRRLLEREEIEAAAAKLPDLRDAVRTSQERVQAAEAALEQLRGRRLAGAEERISNLREGLESIRDSACDDAAAQAAETLDADDAVVQAGEELPRQVEDATATLREERAELEEARRDLADAERLAARAAEMEAAAADLGAAEEQVHAATADGAQAVREAEQARERADAIDLASVERQREALRTERAELAPRLKLAEPLARAEARLAELEPQLEQIRAEITRVEGDVAALPRPGSTPPVPHVDAEERAAAEAEERARRTHAAIAVAEQILEKARAVAGRVAELEAGRRRLDDELADWTRLAHDLGRDGLQAVEIDAAGPELTALVNDLLHSCVSRRWTVTIETTRPSSDGKRQLEGCEVRVLDTERGRDAPVETFSGGERVLIGEAVSLALSVLACRRAGVEAPTLVRDESGAALDPVNGRAYVAMLRRAADLIGASQVLFVSHAPELQELADARIRVDGGRIVIEEG